MGVIFYSSVEYNQFRMLTIFTLLTPILTLATLAAPLTPSPETPELFAEFEAAAEAKLAKLSTSEKIAQLLLVRYPDEDGLSVLSQYQFGGYLFFAKDFRGRSAAEVQTMMRELQAAARIPLLTAVDEEGGSVVRVSSNPLLAEQSFVSPRELYQTGGFALIHEDTLQKSALLEQLGLNLNLAPVVDVSTNPSDYMFKRSLGEDTALTSEYAKVVIESSKSGAVSYTLKHFPGYGNNRDTHAGGAVDARTLPSLLQYDLPPFRAGIDAAAEAVLVSHNYIRSIDPDHPASLSPAIHQLLREALGFSGIIITDDLAMGAVSQLPGVAASALLAGNDLIITTDYAASFRELTEALEQGIITEDLLDQHVSRLLAWKYSKKLLQ